MIQATIVKPEDSLFQRKDKIQTAAAKAVKTKGFKCSVIMGTGIGKTRVLLMSIKLFLDDYKESERSKLKLYIVAPLVDLENQIEMEAKKWNLYDNYYEHFKFLSINKARELEDQVIDFVGVDECHLTFGNGDGQSKSRNFYLNNKIKHAVLFTATLPENLQYKAFMLAYFPVAYQMSYEEAKKNKLVAPYVIFKIPVELTKEEADRLKKLNRIYNHSQYELLGYISPGEMFTESQKVMGDRSLSSQDKAPAFKFMGAVRNRKTLLHGAIQKRSVAIQVIKYLSAGPTAKKKRFMTFSGDINSSIELADDINTSLTKNKVNVKAYHSKITISKRAKLLEEFKTTKNITGLSAVIAGGTGLDIPDLSYIIINALNSKSLAMIQRLGRVGRFKEGKTAYVVIPFIKGSQEEKWTKNSLKTFENVVEVESLKDIFNEIDKREQNNKKETSDQDLDKHQKKLRINEFELYDMYVNSLLHCDEDTPEKVAEWINKMFIDKDDSRAILVTAEDIKYISNKVTRLESNPTSYGLLLDY